VHNGSVGNCVLFYVKQSETQLCGRIAREIEDQCGLSKSTRIPSRIIKLGPKL